MPEDHEHDEHIDAIADAILSSIVNEHSRAALAHAVAHAIDPLAERIGLKCIAFVFQDGVAHSVMSHSSADAIDAWAALAQGMADKVREARSERN